MNNYMISIKLPEVFSQEFMENIAEQRVCVNNLVNRSIISTYITSMDSRQVWMEVQAINEGDVMDLMSTFPLIDFMRFEITQTMMPNFMSESVSHITLSTDMGFEKMEYAFCFL